MALEKLTFRVWNKELSQLTKEKFTVMLNPSELSKSYEIEYSHNRAPGGTNSNPKYNRSKSNDVHFDIILDGTGVVPGNAEPIPKQIKTLKRVVYEYNGSNHEPNIIQIMWGKLKFDHQYWRCKKIDITYTLFKPSGEPLRAKVHLTFTSYLTEKKEALEEGKSSPDLTHEIRFKKSDTLPNLCYQIYGDKDYYREVAAVNGLTSFRNIKAGTLLFFPPLR